MIMMADPNIKGIALAFSFEDFIILPVILVLSVLSMQICYRKLKRAYARNSYQCPNKDCIRCRKKFNKRKLLVRLENYQLTGRVSSHHLVRLENAIIKSDCLNNTAGNINEQNPTVLCMQGLIPIQPFHPVTSDLKILEENESIMAVEEELRNILTEDSLWSKNEVPAGSWKLFYFFNQGKMQSQNCEKCPKTTEIIQKIPSFMKNCSFGNAAFSVLTKGSKIPTHAGATNARLRCHMTILPGSDCSITVHNEQEQYKDNKIILFDDSFPHFVEHRGRKEEVRVVLMIDIWHPGVSSIEREAIQELYSI